MKNKSSILNLALRLAVITVCAGLALGLVYGVTKEPIEYQAELKATQARQTVLPSAQEFEEMDLAAFSADAAQYGEIQQLYKGTAGGELAGYTISIVTRGYSPNLSLTVGLDVGGVVTGVAIGSHEETPGLGANAAKPEFVGQYVGADGPLTLVKTPTGADGEITAITGATITSTAVTNAVTAAKSFFDEHLAKEGA
ncbi:MAG TPA: electron transporter RnfG [Clostridiales bacterium]|nr:electron transporter RnfG [Clostridiales bacterium]